MVLLAGLLGPAAFGTVALASIYVLLVQLLLQQGLAPALIQRQELTRVTCEVAFRLVLLVSIGAVALSWALSPHLGRVFDDSDLSTVIRALSPMLVLGALELVPEALRRRASDFRVLALRGVMAAVLGGVVGVALAVAGAGVWSLVAQQLTTASLSLVLLQASAGWWPKRLKIGRSALIVEVRDLVRFSTRVSAASATSFGSQQADSVLIGLLLGNAAVGIYRLANRVASALSEPLMRASQLALLPDLSRVAAAGTDGLSSRILKAQRRLLVVVVPIFGTIAATAPLLPMALGEEWGPAVGPLQVLSLSAAAAMAGAIAVPALQALSRPGDLIGVNVLTGAFVVGGVIVVAPLLQGASLEAQITAVAGIRLAATLAGPTLLGLWLLARRLRMSPRRLMLPAAASMAPPLGIAMAASAGFEVLSERSLTLAVIALVTVAGSLHGLCVLADIWLRRSTRTARREGPAASVGHSRG